MNKKDFIKGLISGIALAVVCLLALNTSFVQQLIPWQNLPFDIEMSRTAKIGLIEKYLDKYYVDEIDTEMTRETLYAGLVAGVGDRYTYYLTEDSLNRMLENNDGHFEGIGVSVYQTDEGETVVYELKEGYSAQKAGILTGDVIIAVDGMYVRGTSLEDVAGMIRGAVGETVEVEVYRDSDGQNHKFSIVREDVVLETVYYEMLENNKGYIQITGFKENTYSQFKEALTALEAEGMEGLVLDLRNNLGGLVRSVYQIGEELLPQGVMVYTEDKDGNRQEMICDDEYSDIPLVVLVNQNSASASEILAGAVKDTQRGTLVGTQTYGKGLVQRLFTLPDGTGLNITIQKYFTPSGASIHGTGIAPDVEVELSEEYAGQTDIPFEEDVQLREAMDILDEKL